ncbi:hypothetical protein [Ancylomarina longa]|uniref:Uncharacterized protein n=1 Tax=Ancylomarina longa TaxID=2487017 RepID=A0A434AVI9_9BACT|nr:hypothetical protein [Ancylomarina longa]RUT78505.1 hypothetical protein DLK05_07980 [Ancylomarina longa]
MIHNKLDKFFGKAGAILGWLIMLMALLIPYLLTATIFFILGALMAFSYSGIIVDEAEHKYMLYYAIFGIFKTGKWQNLDELTAVAGISPIINRSSYLPMEKDLHLLTEDCFVVLFGRSPKKRIPLKRCKNLLEAKLEAEKIAHILGLQIIH